MRAEREAAAAESRAEGNARRRRAFIPPARDKDREGDKDCLLDPVAGLEGPVAVPVKPVSIPLLLYFSASRCIPHIVG